MERLIEFEGFRALEDPIINVQLGEDALVTELVLGQPQALVMPGAKIFRDTPVTSYQFQYEQRGTEHLDDVDTERAMRAEIKIGDWKTETVVDRLRRYSFGVLKDEDEISNAHPNLRVREVSSSLSRRIVELNLERIKRDLLTATTSYGDGAGSGDTDLTGSEWNAAGGDAFTDIRAACKVISDATGLPYEALSVFMADDAYRAAQQDPTFKAARHNTTTNIGMQKILADYYGVREVWTANPLERVSGTVTPMYSDEVIIYYAGDGHGMDTEFGDFNFATNFMWNRGVASTPFYKASRTSWVFPWTAYARPKIIGSYNAHLLTGMVA